MRNFQNVCVTLFISLSISAVLFVGLNAAAAYLVKKNPELIMTQADRINENTRSVREGMIVAEEAEKWFALESGDEVSAMWEEFYNAGAEFASFVHYKSRTLEGKYYGTSDDGYRKVKNQGPWPPAAENYNIFFFGGSTSFGVGPYWATVASYLQEELENKNVSTKPVKVYNFGRSGYHSSQEVILYGRLLAAGYKPDAVVFMDGLNDFCFSDGMPSGWTSLQRFFNQTQDANQKQNAGFGVNTDWLSFSKFLYSLPAIKLLDRTVERMVAPPIPEYVNDQPNVEIVDEKVSDPTIISEVIDRYIENMLQVVAINEHKGISSVMLWQPIPTYKYTPKYHKFYPNRLGCHVNSKFGYPVMAAKSASLGLLQKHFIWGADLQEDKTENLYVDAFHYTAPMSKEIAQYIVSESMKKDLFNLGAR